MDKDKRKFLFWSRLDNMRKSDKDETKKLAPYLKVLDDIMHVLEPCELGGRAMGRLIEELATQRPVNTTILETLKLDAGQLVKFAPEVLAEIGREAQCLCTADREEYLNEIADAFRGRFPTWGMDKGRIAANLGKISMEEDAVISYVVGEVLENVESAAAEMWLGISRIREEVFKLPRILDTKRAAVAIMILREEGSVGIADDRKHLEWRGEHLSHLAYVAEKIWADLFKTYPTKAIAELFQEPGFGNARREYLRPRSDKRAIEYYDRLLRDLPPL